MPTEPITGWPYDSAQDAPNGAAQLLRLVTAATGAGGEAVPVLRVKDAADRDAKYPTPKPGYIAVTTQAPWTIWFYTDTKWLPVFSDTGWITAGFQPGPNWAIGSYMRGSRVGSTIYIEGESTYTGSTDIRGANTTDPSPGNLSPDQILVTVPPQFTPGGTLNGGVLGAARCSGTSGNLQLYPGGNVLLGDISTNGKISTGDFCRFSFTFRAAS